MTERYLLDGLHCANCGEKIRRSAEGLKGVKRAQLSLATATLLIEREGGTPLTERLQKICNQTEDGITVSFLSGEGEAVRHERDGSYITVIVSAVLFVAGLVLHILDVSLPSALLLVAAAGISAAKPAWVGIKGLLRLDIEENLLLVIAVIAAIAIGEYTEAAAVALLFAVGQQIEGAVSRRSRKSLEVIGEIRPDTVHTDNGDKPAEQVQIGEIIIVHAGERIPLDGMVVGGSSAVDASAITGESVPISAEYGTTLLGGMLNGSGVLRVQVTGDYHNSAAARIIELVEQSAQRKGTAERFITRFARVYTPLCVLAAVLITVIPWMLQGSFSVEWLRKALVFLVAACPCALVISVPLAFYAGVGAASRQGVLIKGGVFIEALANADAIGFDKTGTLTTGRLKVSEVISIDEDVLPLAAAAEAHSDHPIAQAIRVACATPATLEGSVTEHAGYGVEVSGERHILVGAARLMSREGVDISALPEATVYVAVDGRAIGCIEVTDTLREETPSLISALKERGVKRIALLSGDHEAAVKWSAEQSGISEEYCSLLPQDKVEIMQGIKQSAKAALFVGDGINDAPVLASATAGVAMGLGTDAAIQAADVVLPSSPMALLTAIDISRRTMRTVKLNIAISIGIKLAVMLSAFFVPMMWAAVVADVVLSVVCSLNSASLLAVPKAQPK